MKDDGLRDRDMTDVRERRSEDIGADGVDDSREAKGEWTIFRSADAIIVD